MQFSLLTLLGVVTIVAVILGILPIVRLELALRALSNNDIKVDGGYLGLRVDLESQAAEQLKRIGPKANNALERAIADSERFAAAHILLSEINNERQSSYGESASHWNNMRITLHADGSVDFHAEQIPKLQAFWRDRLAKKLPPAS